MTTGPHPAPTPTQSPTPRETLPPVHLAGDRDLFSMPPKFQGPGGGVSPNGVDGPATSRGPTLWDESFS